MALLHANATKESLDFLRVWVFGIWFIYILFDPIATLAGFSPEVFHPVGALLKFLSPSAKSIVLTGGFLNTLKIATLASLFLVIVNKFRVLALALSCLLLSVYQGIMKGFGYINHAEFSILYAAYFIALFIIVDELFLKDEDYDAKKINKYSIPFVSIMAFLSLTYVLIGLYRLVHGGPKLFLSDSMSYWVVHSSNRIGFISWHLDNFYINSPWLQMIIKGGFPIGTIFEIFAPFCLINRKFRLIFVTYMMSFHAMIYVFMGIIFWENVLMYIVFIDVCRWLNPVTSKSTQPIILFDGVCGLCDRFVSWLSKADHRGIYQFTPLQGDKAKELNVALPKETKEWSVIFYDERGLSQGSTAILRILNGLGGLWRLSTIAYLIPVGIRDYIYRFVAVRRYQWFKKLETCRLPQESEKGRFLA